MNGKLGLGESDLDTEVLGDVLILGDLDTEVLGVKLTLKLGESDLLELTESEAESDTLTLGESDMLRDTLIDGDKLTDVLGVGENE